MRNATLLFASFGLALAVGCEDKTPPSATGGKATQGEEGAGTFKMKELDKVEVTQGETKEVTIEIDREDGFTAPVELEFGKAEMIKVVVDNPVIGADEDEKTVRIQAERGSFPGETKIVVTAKPKDGGKEAKRDIIINVTKQEE